MNLKKIKTKRLVVVTLFLFCMNIVMAQDSLYSEVLPFPKVIFTFSPISLVNFRVPAAQFGVEYKVGKQSALHHELGYVYFRENEFLEKKGIRHRSEYRIYLNEMGREKQLDYIGIQFRYWQFSSPMVRDFSRNDGQYQQRIAFTGKQSAIGAGVSYGTNVIKKKGFVFDFGISLGMLHLKNKPEGIPDDAISFNDRFWGRDKAVPYESTQPYFLIIAKVGYAIK